MRTNGTKREKRFYVYRNLHTKTFSMRYGGRVISHPTEVILADVLFKVSEKGRQRVLKNRRKNVHATVAGYAIDMLPEILDFYTKVEVYYNPYKTETFVYKDTGKLVLTAKYVLCKDNRIYILQ